MAVAAALFAVLESIKLDPNDIELIISTGFFVCIIALARFYFWPKIHLLVQGADLDKNFQIVFPKKVVNEVDESISASTRAATLAAASGTAGNTIGISERDMELLKKYLPRMPKTMDDCRIIMEHLAQHNMVRGLLPLLLTLTQSKSSIYHKITLVDPDQSSQLYPSLHSLSQILTQKATGDSNSGSSSHGSSRYRRSTIYKQISQRCLLLVPTCNDSFFSFYSCKSNPIIPTLI